MSVPKAANRRPLRALAVLGVALAVGGLAGAAFAVRESARVLLEAPLGAQTAPQGGVLRLGLYALVRYGALGVTFGGFVGLLLAAVVATGRRAVAASTAAACQVGAAGFAVASVLLVLRHERFLRSRVGTAYVLAEVGALALLVGLGGAAAVRWLEGRWGWRRLLAGAVAALAALFLLGNGAIGVWLIPAERLWLTAGALAGAAVLLAGGLYVLLAPAPVPYRPSRRRALGAGLAAAGGALLAVRPRRAMPPIPSTRRRPRGAQRPNVLWIVMDTARADALSCYGNARPTTPHLDALAEQGALFERAISPAPWTLPAHAAMFTGLATSRIETTAEHEWLDDRFTPIAEVLARGGYRTLGYSNNPHISKLHNLHRGFHRLRVHNFGRSWRREMLAHRFAPQARLADYGARETTRAAQSWITDCCAQEQPFFLFLNYMEPHRKYGVTPQVPRWLPDGVSPAQALSLSQDVWGHYAGVRDLTEHAEVLRALYDSDVRYLDAWIGRLIGHLRRLEILDQTLVIVTSDHGEHFGEHGHISHVFSLYRELLHVPLIVRYPEAWPRGSRISRLVQTLDIGPTVLELAGLDAPRGPSGSAPSLLQTPATGRTRFAVAESDMPLHVIHHVCQANHRFDAAPLMRRLKSIESTTYKYIWASDGRDELYRIADDPQEAQNLAARMPDQVRRLRAELEAHLGQPLVRVHELLPRKPSQRPAAES
jgi:arylsulfatase A-like enzyme